MRVLEGAFRLFLNSTYESVSTSDIEREIGLTRGAIYYTYKSKAELFKAVIDYYILNKQDVFHKTGFVAEAAKWITLKEYLEVYINGAQNVVESMRTYVKDGQNGFGGYFSLLYQAHHLYDGFDKILYDTFCKEYHFIRAVVQHAIDTKEIRALDADMVAHHIRYIFIGYAFEESFNGSFTSNNVALYLMSYYTYLKG